MGEPDPSGGLGFDDVFQHAPCGYVIVDPQGVIKRINTTIENWTGRSAADLVGRRVPDLLKVAGKIFFETHVAPLLKIQGSLNEIALDLRTRDGNTIQVLVNAVERRDADGIVVCTYFVMFAASERRRYERSLVTAQEAAETARRQVEALNASLTDETREAIAQRTIAETGLRAERETAVLREQFIAVLGHDLRNPLAAVSSAARVLSREALSERGRLVVDLMQGSVGRMASLIDNVLDFARGSLGGGIGIKLETQDGLSQILFQVVEELRAGNPEREIDATIEISVPVECDGSRIGQLVSNLLGNALAHGAADEPVRLLATVSAEILEISISNGGHPISADAVQKLFQPFFRGDNRDPSRGLGLGLYIASEIAKAHRGTLEVFSDESETRFTFRMPIAV